VSDGGIPFGRCDIRVLKEKPGGTAVTVKIDGVEPNIFPSVEHLDARDAGRNVEVFFEVRIEGKPTPVTVRLSYPQAAALADLLEPFRSLAI
jgi:hypothetical protein